MGRALIVALLATLVAWSSAPAHAQEDPHDPQQAAESHYQTAVRLFGEGRYREALDEFDEAIRISPEPVFYCNRAIVLIKLQEAEEAVGSFRTCRDTFTGARSDRAEIDAQMLGVSTFVDNLRPHARQVADEIAAGPIDRVQPPPSPPDRGWSATDFGLISIGLGAAALGSAVTLDLLSAPLVEEYKENAENGGDRGRYEELRQTIEARQRVWWGLSIGSGVFVLTGLSLIGYDVLRAEDDRSSQIMITPWVGLNEVGVSVVF